MRLIATFLSVLFASTCFGQNSKEKHWFSLFDSVGNSVTDTAGNYFIDCQPKLNAQAKREIRQWLDSTNNVNKSSVGVLIINENWYAYFIPPNSEWTIFKSDAYKEIVKGIVR